MLPWIPPSLHPQSTLFFSHLSTPMYFRPPFIPMTFIFPKFPLSTCHFPTPEPTLAPSYSRDQIQIPQIPMHSLLPPNTPSSALHHPYAPILLTLHSTPAFSPALPLLRATL